MRPSDLHPLPSPTPTHLFPPPLPRTTGESGADGEHDAAGAAVKGAYDKVIRPYHSWLLRKTFDIVSTQIPTVEEAFAMMGPGLGDAERENKASRRLLSASPPPLVVLPEILTTITACHQPPTRYLTRSSFTSVLGGRSSRYWRGCTLSSS